MKASSSRKILAACLALLLVSGSVPAGPVADLFGSTAVTASAADNQCGESAIWNFDSTTGTLTISGSGAMKDYEFGDQPWDNYKNNITSVEIENGITSIGSSAFDSFTELSSVSIPDSVTSIGESAFADCYGLKSVKIGSGVTSIGQEAFKSCDGLTSITIPDSVISIGSGAFNDCRSLTSITIPDNVTSIGESAFAYCWGLESVEIGSGVESIGDDAFIYCSGLTSITIPDSVTSIGDNAFNNCIGITDVYCYAVPANLTWNEGDCDDFIKTPKHTTVCHVPAEHIETYNSEKFSDVNVTFIGEESGQCGENAYWMYDSVNKKLLITGTGAMYNYEYDSETNTINSPWFAYKDNITSVEIENGITSIGNSSFDSCAKLTSVSIPDSVTSIGEVAFAFCEGLTSITIPDSVKSIGVYAFAYCEGLKSVEIGSGVESIGKTSFYYCTGLTSIEIPASVTSIGESAFDSCTGLTSITLPDSVKSIGGYAFSGCSSLESITIPEKVTSIGYNAFSNCTNITDVYCYADPANLAWDDYKCDDFKKDGSTVCHVPAEHLSDYNTKFGAGSENPVNVTFCPSGKCGENAIWTFYEDTGLLTISGSGEMYNTFTITSQP